MAYQCRLCFPHVRIFADEGNMKSHLGATGLAGHNMGPWRCQHPNCTLRSVRKYVVPDDGLQGFLANDHCSVPNAKHGNHNAVWFNDPALVAPRNAEAARCKLPWAPAPVVAPPAVAAAVVQAPVVVGPPVVVPPVVAPAVVAPAAVAPAALAQGPSGAAPGLATMAPLAGAVQGPPAVAQAPAVAAPAAQVPAPAPVVQAPMHVDHVPTQDTDASTVHLLPPPTDYFNPVMDEIASRYADKTREDIEEQYEEGM